MVDIDEPWIIFTDDVYRSFTDNGDVVSDTKVYEWTGDETTQSRWASQNSLSLTPAGTGGYFTNAKAYHDWRSFGGSTASVVENAPEDSFNGKESSVTIGVEYNSVSISWTYTQLSDVERKVDEKTTSLTKYDWIVDDFDRGEDESTFETGTEIAAESGPDSITDPLFSLDGFGYFVNGNEEYTSDFTQYFEVQDG